MAFFFGAAAVFERFVEELLACFAGARVHAVLVLLG